MAPIPPIHTDESLDTSATDSTVDTIAASVTTSDSEFPSEIDRHVADLEDSDNETHVEHIPSAYDHKHTDIATASEAHVSVSVEYPPGYIHTTTADDIVDITAHDVSASDEKSDSADFLDAVQQQLEDGDVTLDRMVQLEDGDVTPDRMVQLMIEAGLNPRGGNNARADTTRRRDDPFQKMKEEAQRREAEKLRAEAEKAAAMKAAAKKARR